MILRDTLQFLEIKLLKLKLTFGFSFDRLILSRKKTGPNQIFSKVPRKKFNHRTPARSRNPEDTHHKIIAAAFFFHSSSETQTSAVLAAKVRIPCSKLQHSFCLYH